MTTFKTHRTHRPTGLVRSITDSNERFKRVLALRPRRVGYNLDAAIAPPDPTRPYAGAPGIRRFYGRIVAINAQEIDVAVGEVPSGAASTLTLLAADFQAAGVTPALRAAVRVIVWLDGEVERLVVEDARA